MRVRVCLELVAHLPSRDAADSSLSVVKYGVSDMALPCSSAKQREGKGGKVVALFFMGDGGGHGAAWCTG